jgi:peptide/nickel transport system permease protein
MAQYATNARMTTEDREALRERLGLNDPLPIQYFKWLGLALQGELGNSFFSKQPVSLMISQRLPNTLILMVTAEIITVSLALVLGILSAVKQYSVVDNVITTLSFIGFSMPELIQHLILPVSALVIILTAGYARYIRASMLEVLGLDYVRTARAKGLTSRAVLFKHALRNAALPLVTIIGLDIPFLLGGALVTEQVYAWPGMGRLFWEYAQRGDFPVVLGILLIISTAVVIFTIVTDIVYTFVDPRIRLG